MRAAVAAGVVLGCGSYVAPPTSRFEASPVATTQPQIAEIAITVRGTEGVFAAGGSYLGIVISESSGSDVAIVRDAARKAARVGGTHILLRQANIDRVEHSVSLVGRPGDPSRRFVPVATREVTAVFDVFRVEPDRWSLLHPQMRPTAAR